MRTIDPIQVEKAKQSKYKGNSDAQALRDAGQSESTALHNVGPDNKLLKTVKNEIIQELLAKDVNINLIIKRLNEDRELARLKGDISTMTRTDELMGKHIAMFTDKTEQTNKTPDKIVIMYNKEPQHHINRIDTTKEEVET